MVRLDVQRLVLKRASNPNPKWLEKQALFTIFYFINFEFFIIIIQFQLFEVVMLIKGLPSKVSSIKGCLPSKVVFHPRLSHIKGHLVLKVIFNQSSSSIKVRIAPKFVFHQSLSSIKFHLPSKFFFHQRLSSIKGHLRRLPSKVIFH